MRTLKQKPKHAISHTQLKSAHHGFMFDIQDKDNRSTSHEQNISLQNCSFPKFHTNNIHHFKIAAFQSSSTYTITKRVERHEVEAFFITRPKKNYYQVLVLKRGDMGNYLPTKVENN